MVSITGCNSTIKQTSTSSSLLTPQLTAENATPTNIPYSNIPYYGNNFGDGYIPWYLTKEAGNLSPEDLVRIMVTQLLEHYKTQSKAPKAAIKDYKLGVINVIKAITNDPNFYEILGGVQFSIIPAQIPSDWGSFPGEGATPGDSWWHLGTGFIIFRDGGYFRLQLRNDGG